MTARFAIIQSSIKDKILVAQNEASEAVNAPAEMLRGLDDQMERMSDGALYYLDRIWVPLMGDVRTLIMDEAHKSKYSVHEGIVLGHKVFEEGLEVDKAKIDVISKLPPPTNIKAQQNYTMTEKELMAIVFAFDKFRSYLVLSKTIVHTDHLALRHLFKKQDVKPCLIRWIMLLQEFDIKIKDRKCTENVVADHLSRIENEETSDDNEVEDNFPGGTLMEINTEDDPWFTDFANYLASDIIPKGMTYQQKKFFSQTSNTTSGWNPTSKIATDYVSKWAEVQALPTNDARVVITFLKKLLCGFGMPKALISDKGTHFCNKIMEKTMKRYGVNHRFSTSYHPHTSVKVENTNKALKRILEKTVKDNPTIWSRKLDDAPWTFCTAYKTPTKTTPYKLIYGKNCHLPFKIEHRAY
ncbi:reverse transcriptase domain-containing protein [Tanacetum coccineum]